MSLSYTISQDRRTLTVFADTETRVKLLDLGDEIGQDRHLWDAFDRMLANSELAWIGAEVCGDLTDAPILGIYGETTTEPGGKQVGRWGDPAHNRYQHVLERWAFLPYALRSPLQDLIDTGAAVFTAP